MRCSKGNPVSTQGEELRTESKAKQSQDDQPLCVQGDRPKMTKAKPRRPWSIASTTYGPFNAVSPPVATDGTTLYIADSDWGWKGKTKAPFIMLKIGGVWLEKLVRFQASNSDRRSRPDTIQTGILITGGQRRQTSSVMKLADEVQETGTGYREQMRKTRWDGDQGSRPRQTQRT